MGSDTSRLKDGTSSVNEGTGEGEGAGTVLAGSFVGGVVGSLVAPICTGVRKHGVATAGDCDTPGVDAGVHATIHTSNGRNQMILPTCGKCLLAINRAPLATRSVDEVSIL